MQDFRLAKETVKRVVAEIKEKDPNWSWRAEVLKSEIRVWWGYLQYCDNENSHFTIKMSDRVEECGDTDNFVVARNEHDEYMEGAILGFESWADGNLDKCVEYLLRRIASIAHSRY